MAKGAVDEQDRGDIRAGKFAICELAVHILLFPGALPGSLFSTGCKKSSSAATAPTSLSATLADSSFQTSGQWDGVTYEPQDTGFIITVTAWDPGQRTIAGTFSGVLYVASTDSLVVSNGVFNAGYPSN